MFLLLLLAAALSPLLRPGRLRQLAAHPLWFGLSLALTSLAYRWPSLAREEMSHDESLHVTIGIALGRDPLPWRAMDGASAGCLVHYPLTFLNGLGLEPTYGTARLFGLLATALALVLLWRTLRALLEDEALSRLAVLPALAAYALAQHRDFLAYNSEQPLNLLMAAALFLLVRSWKVEAQRGWTLFSLGLCLGAIPLTKLQGAPAGLLLALAGYALLWLQERERRARLTRGLLLTAGGVLPLALTLVVLASADLVEFFFRSTFVDGATYTQMMTGRSVGRRVLDLGSFVFLDSGAKDLGTFHRALIFPALALAGGLCLRRVRRTWGRRERWAVVTSLAFLGATLFGILYPGTRFPHYLLLTLPPLTLCWGLVLLTLLRAERRTLALGLALALPLNVAGSRPFSAPLQETEARYWGEADVPRAVAPFLGEDDWLATWGLDLRYCVQTRRPFHAQMPFPFRFAPHVKQRDYWLEGYLARWRETQPPVLVATSASPWRLEWVAPVRRHVLERYRLVDAFFDRVYQRRVRIFVRRERLAELLGSGRLLGRPGVAWVPTCARTLDPPERLYRTLVDFDAPLPDGEDLRAGTDLAWGLVRGSATLGPLHLEAGARDFTFLARTLSDDDPELAEGLPHLEGRLRLRLLRGGRAVASQEVRVGPFTAPGRVRLEVPAEGDYQLELRVELERAGGVAVAELRSS